TRRDYIYEKVTVPARVGVMEKHDILIPWHRAPGESDDDHQERIRYMRPWGGNPAGTGLKRGHRNIVESVFSRWDAMREDRRLVAWSRQSKARRVYGVMISKNLVQLARTRGAVNIGQAA
nr:hypothetical protein [Actinomycetes bacterium]